MQEGHELHLSPEQVVDDLAEFVRDARVPGSYISMPPWERVNFGVEHDGGYSTVIAWPPTKDSVPESWFLQVASGIAYEVPDIPGALHWANSKNRAAYTGRYVVAVGEDSVHAAVAYITSMSSALIDSDTREIWNWLFQMITHAETIAAGYPDGFISAHGGKRIDEDFLAGLAMIALAP
jgi:hypothetical protein